MAHHTPNLLKNEEAIDLISWKSIPLLKQYMTRFDNIKPRKYSKHSVATQKKLKQAISRAREL